MSIFPLLLSLLLRRLVCRIELSSPPKSILYLYKSTIRLWRRTVAISGLGLLLTASLLLNRIQKCISDIVGHDLVLHIAVMLTPGPSSTDTSMVVALMNCINLLLL